jgi:uncharacterized repeat protein (TIGR01451 family)
MTWADVDDVTANYGGGIAISPLGFEGNGGLEVHNLGEVWMLTLWEVRSRVIADPAGANGDVPTGNRTMLQLVTDALKMTPANPSVVEARDALIAADCATNACANERWIWEGFADRGLGYKAVAPLAIMGQSNVGHMGVGESFASPNLDVASVVVDDSQGNNNGAIDPGEPIRLSVRLANPWRAASAGVGSATATLASNTPGVTVYDPSAAYGAIAAQATVAGDPFLFTLATSAACGQSLTFTVQVNSALGSVTRDLTLRVGTPSGTGAPITYTKSGVGLAIPDVTPTGVFDTLTISDDYEIADLNFRVDSLTHTYTGDLTAMLKAPDGYGGDLVFLRGTYLARGNADNFLNTVIDGQSTNDLNQAMVAQAPFTGSWAPAFNSALWTLFNDPAVFPDPVDQMSRFNGLSTKGTWMAHVADVAAQDTGTLNGWSLIITPRAFTCAAFTPAANVVGTKSVSGSFLEGGAVTYTVVLTNTGSGPQADNPGNEFTDVLPPELTLVSATASAGTAAATIATNTVTWNGALNPVDGAVTLTIQATINAGTSGQTVSNQGSISYDADLNGTNEASGVTDDPGTAAVADPTVFGVALPSMAASKIATLLVDQNGNGQVNPGDTLRYTIVVSNAGGVAGSSVVLTDSLDANTTLVVGSVTSSQGSVASGNTAGDTAVRVEIGSVAASGTVTIHFNARIAPALPEEVTQVSNQASVSGANFASLQSDDPQRPGAADATLTAVERFLYVYLPLVVRAP